MKSFLIVSFLVTLALGQEGEECRCGGFVTVEEGEEEVLSIPPKIVENCDETKKCSELCELEWREITGGGDLCHTTEDGSTVGQEMCDTLASRGIEDIEPHEVFLYYSVCEEQWMFDGHTSKQKLDCQQGKLELNC